MIDNKKFTKLLSFIIILFVHIFGLNIIASAQDTPPSVEVDFSIEASNFKDNLPNLSQTEKELGSSVATLCTELFPFLQWHIRDDGGRTSVSKEHRLNIVLTHEDAIPLPRIVLTFKGVIEGRTIKLPAIANVVVFKAYELDRPTHNSRAFYLKVYSELKNQFLNESFRGLLHKHFLSSIPMSQHVVVAEAEHRVIIPIQWELLRLGVESVFEVDFVRRIAPGNEKGGSMKLSSVQKRRHEPNPGSVQGAIQSLDFAPILIVRLGDWHDDIPKIFSGDVGIKVFMEKYVEKVNPNTEAGLVTRPD